MIQRTCIRIIVLSLGVVMTLAVGLLDAQFIYTIRSPGSEGWKNPAESRAPPSQNPGSLGWQAATQAEKDGIALEDTSWWVTYNPDTTTFNSQLYRFRVTQPLNKIGRLTFRWYGHREGSYHPTVQLFIWEHGGMSTYGWLSGPGGSGGGDEWLEKTYQSADTIRAIVTDSGAVYLSSETYKGSCPLLFAWNGKGYGFLGDVLAGANLGLWVDRTLGTNLYLPSDPDEYLKLSGEQLQAKDGLLSLKLNEMKQELSYIDQVRLLAVDHPKEEEVYPNEAFVQPPPAFKVYGLAEERLPLSARDGEGRDVSSFLKAADRRYVPSPTNKPLSLELDLGPLENPSQAALFLTGSTRFSDDDVASEVGMRYRLKQRGKTVQFPRVEVIGKDGRWHKTGYCGYPAGTTRTMVYPLQDSKGKLIFPTLDHRLHLTFDQGVYLDKAWVGDRMSDQYRLTEVPLARSDLHYYGYSACYSEDGQYPPAYHYDQKVEEDFVFVSGKATRYGDVSPLLSTVDDRFVVLHHGDEVDLGFDPQGLPELPQGWVRDYFVYANGFYKEALPGRAYAYTVEPLPFHGMREDVVGKGMGYYPYDQKSGLVQTLFARLWAKKNWDFPFSWNDAKEIIACHLGRRVKDRYPQDADHLAYQKEWNTRSVAEYYPELYADLPHRNAERVPLLAASPEWVAKVKETKALAVNRHHSLYSNYVELLVDTILTGVEERGVQPVVPEALALLPNSPNPFRERTEIGFALPKEGVVTLRVYNGLGQTVRTLLSGRQSAGSHSVWWDGRDESGKRVPGGVYFYGLDGGDLGQARRKMLRLD